VNPGIFLVLLLVWGVAAAAAPDSARSMEFFSVSAQIIPVLLLVMAIEGRIFEGQLAFAQRGRGQSWIDRLLGLFVFYNVLGVLLYMLVAEFSALAPLATGHLADGSPPFIFGAIAVGFATIVVLAFTPRRPPDRDSPPTAE
jgi:hypothetical protein